MEETQKKFDEIFKDYLSKEKCYEFLLKAQTQIKKDIRKNLKSLEFFQLLTYSINHLKQFNEKESIYSMLSTTLDQYISRNPKIPKEVEKDKLVKSFVDAFSLYTGLPNSSNFKSKFLSYCKENNLDEKFLRLCNCYYIFGKDSLIAKQYIEAYNYIIKSGNSELLIELFDNIKNFIGKDDKTQENNLFKNLGEEEYCFLIVRTALELLINKQLEVCFEFVGKYYKIYGKVNDQKEGDAFINFGYSLTCLLIREPKGFDHFWALINLYKGVIEKKYDIQFYLNKISIVYYNKPFLKTK